MGGEEEREVASERMVGHKLKFVGLASLCPFAETLLPFELVRRGPSGMFPLRFRE